MTTACFQQKKIEENLTNDKCKKKTRHSSFRGHAAASFSQMTSALCLHPALHFLLLSLCHVHLPSSAVHVQFRQFPRSLCSLRCCLCGKDSCTLLSSCALDQSALAVPNIKHKTPPVKGLSGSQEIWKHKDLPSWEDEVSRTPSNFVFLVVRLPSDLWKRAARLKYTQRSSY